MNDLGALRNATRGKTLAATGLPPKLLDLLKAGGIYALLEKDSSLEPRTATSG